MKQKITQLKLWPRKQYGVSTVPGVVEGWHVFTDGKLTFEGKVYYQFRTAAREIGISVPTLRRWVSKGVSTTEIQIDLYEHGDRRLVPEATVLALKNSQEARRAKLKAKTPSQP